MVLVVLEMILVLGWGAYKVIRSGAAGEELVFLLQSGQARGSSQEVRTSYSRSTELEVPVEKPTDGYF